MKHDEPKKTREQLLQSLALLESENKSLRTKLHDADSEWSRNIDTFVDEWFEENKDEIQIGLVDFRFFKVDLFPDYLEKHIYKKVIKVLYSFLTSTLAPTPK
tara:strand:- start:13 stop:318 length:306 start_codon:yes stop_codon:yes gene_type:complete